MEATPILSGGEFNRLAVCAARDYLDFLRESQALAGRSTTRVERIVPQTYDTCYEFLLSDRIKPNADYQIFYRGTHIENLKTVKALGPKGLSQSVQVSDETGFLQQLPQINPSDFLFVSDLRFLIENLQHFYENNPINFYPFPPLSLPALPSSLTADFSFEQQAAYDTIFSAPFSYIHGAPGTGKTNMVLSRAIIRYILAQKRVLLLAPTNNALEQMLRGILPVLREIGIDLHVVYRLGISSHEFALQFPEVVGDSNTDNMLFELHSREAALHTKLDEIQRSIKAQEREKAKKLGELEHNRILGNNIIQCMQAVSAAHTKYALLSDEAAEHLSTLAALENQLSDINRTIEHMRTKYTADSLVYSQLERSTHTLSSLFWSKSQKNETRDQLSNMVAALDGLQNEQMGLQIKRNAVAGTIKTVKGKLYHIDSSKTQLQSGIQLQLSRLNAFASGNPLFHDPVQFAVSTESFDTKPISNILDHEQELFDQYLSSIPKNDIGDLQLALLDIQEQIKQISQSSRQQQHEKALVLAGTVDSALYELHEFCSGRKSNTPYHIFLDEAGYTSIARGAAAFSLGVPVTYLGDHNQLPPICEKPRIGPDEKELCIWALSCAYIPDMLYRGVDYLYDYCLAEKSVFSPPSFDHIAFAQLSKSYRFGQSLAQILGAYIYGPQFQGVAAHDFEVVILDTPFNGASGRRSSLSEAAAVKHFLGNNPNDRTVVLTPYKDQVKLLKRTLGNNFNDNVLTVHRSQGREWDTVILSVVDTHNPYFTNSQLSVGRSVLCTAISRAKHRLVLVCDVAAWKNKENQLISHLIQCGKLLF